MEHLQQDKLEDPISFDLGTLFDENSENLTELNADDIPDNVLSEIIMDPSILNTEQSRNMQTLEALNDPMCTPKSNTENRFKNITKQQVDDITGKTCKKTTHKQTDWGIKVFKGK